MSPRQKMINLMYIVLTAMLALNVSGDVLNGFQQVEDGLSRSNETSTERNASLLGKLIEFNETNPEKGGVWLKKAREVKDKTDSLFNHISLLKIEIARKADGKDGDPKNLKSQDDLEAAAAVMLAPVNSKGSDLRKRIDSYRNYTNLLINDSVKLGNINKILSSAPHKIKNTIGGNKTWEERQFDNMPAIAAITILTKLQNDIRYVEGEVLNALIANVDAGDIRVNQVEAFVIPESRIVMSGSNYKANIVLAAVDTTQRPLVFIGDKQLDNDRGIYEFGTGRAGTYDYTGYIEVPHGDGSIEKLPFSSSYTVIEPMASVSATMVNVLYAGINNPISIAVPGVPNSAISASMTNGTISRSGNGWIARPGKVGTNSVITVTANMSGRSQTVARTEFRVRKLPDPTPFISYKDAKGNPERYKGGRPFSKTLLMQANGIEAAIDDDMLNVAYKVLSFETVFFDSMGNAIPEVSSGSNFSERQRASFRRLSRGKRFYISRVKAIGPDGIERILAPMEVIVN